MKKCVAIRADSCAFLRDSQEIDNGFMYRVGINMDKAVQQGRCCL